MILSQLRQDGTFNQLRPVERLQRELSRKCLFASIDLSAATDRLPISLQKSLLSCLLSGKIEDAGLFAEA